MATKALTKTIETGQSTVELYIPHCGVDYGLLMVKLWLYEGLDRSPLAVGRDVIFDTDEIRYAHWPAHTGRYKGVNKMPDAEFELFVTKHECGIVSLAVGLLYPKELDDLKRPNRLSVEQALLARQQSD